MTSSNANTSGLEVVAWRQGSLVSTDPRCAETAGWDGLVTAASANCAARNALMMQSALSETINAQMARATAAEARADRLAISIADIVLALRGFIVSLPNEVCEKHSDSLSEITEAVDRATAALQQEG